MNTTHLHLVVNHLRIIFPVVGIIILLIGIFTKSEIAKRNSYLIFILGAAASVLAMATGEGAEEGVEHIAGVSESLIKTHEEAAELFAGLSYVLGAVSVFALIANFKNWSFSKFFPVVTLIIGVPMMYFAQEAGRTGGEIRHTEIRNGASVQNGDQGENSAENANSESGEEDED